MYVGVLCVIECYRLCYTICYTVVIHVYLGQEAGG